MAYYIKRQSLVDSSIMVYYIGDNRWSDDPSQKIEFESEEEVIELMHNPDGRNGGWGNAIIISE
jgi:hypothetical protein